MGANAIETLVNRVSISRSSHDSRVSESITASGTKTNTVVPRPGCQWKAVLYPLTKDGSKYLRPAKRWYFDLRQTDGTN